VLRRLEVEVFPVIGARPIGGITAPELLAMVKKIEARGAGDIAKRAWQTCGQIFWYAIAHGRAQRNPAADVRPSDALKARSKTHYARVKAKELPELMRKIEACRGTPITRLAMKLTALTFVRTSELIAARWDEFDVEAAEWRIPAERMKMRTPHIVPLSVQAVDHPARARVPARHHRLQLAHQEGDQVSAAYNFATHLPRRRKMMQDWADHLEQLRMGAKIIPLQVAYGWAARVPTDKPETTKHALGGPLNGERAPWRSGTPVGIHGNDGNREQYEKHAANRRDVHHSKQDCLCLFRESGSNEAR